MYKSYKTADEAEAAAIKYAEENLLIDFDGMNCNNYLDEDAVECGGWDGVSRRCECDNRRVSWNIEKNPDGTFYAVARAY